MVKNTEDSASKFINALIKSVQTLCHGYLDFSDGIQIVGYINLSVDQGPQLDYILKEKVCKNAENSTLFISNSFHAEQKLDQEAGKDSGQRTSEDSEESGRVGSAISSISSALITSRDRHRRGVVKDSDSFHSSQSSGKRKASNDAEVRPSKVSLHHDNSSDSQSPYRSQSSPIESKESLRSHLRTAPEMDMGETMLPQTAGVSGDTAADIGVNLASSVLEPVEDHGDLPERDDDSDGDLEVTFIKEEFVEGERSACEYGSSGGQQFGGPHQRASEGLPDPSLYPVSLQSSSASATYVPGAHDFQPGPSTSQPGHSGMREQTQPSHGLLPENHHFVAQPSAHHPFKQRTHSLHKQVLHGNAGHRAVVSDSLSPSSRSYSCEICGTILKSAAAVKGHINAVHLKLYRYFCEFCGKGFAVKEHCVDHMNMHKHVKAHQCYKCSKAFTFKTHLRRHLRFNVCRN